jgi:hypothetical protein
VLELEHVAVVFPLAVVPEFPIPTFLNAMRNGSLSIFHLGGVISSSIAQGLTQVSLVLLIDFRSSSLMLT